MMAEQAAKKVASPLYLGFDFSTQQVESKISVRPTALHAVKLVSRSPWIIYYPCIARLSYEKRERVW